MNRKFAEVWTRGGSGICVLADKQANTQTDRHPYHNTSHLFRGGRYIVISVSASLSVCSHISETAGSNFTNFLCSALTGAVAASSSGGFAIRYVLPVLWMTSFLSGERIARQPKLLHRFQANLHHRWRLQELGSRPNHRGLLCAAGQNLLSTIALMFSVVVRCCYYNYSKSRQGGAE